jgi:Domain of unknown function (DUF222)/HNH endonuclease
MCSTDVVPADNVSAPDRANVSARDRFSELEELERHICGLQAHIEAATCRWLLLVAEFDQRGGWADWGYKSCAQWLSWRCSLAPGAARERVRVARALRELPLVQAAFAADELSYCKVRAITRVAVPEIESELVEIARQATGAQLEKLVRGYRSALSATLGAAQRAHERRHLTLTWEDDGSLRLTGRLRPEDGALLLAALAAHERPPAPAQPGAERDHDPAGARRADALVSLARCGRDAPVHAPSGGEEYQLVVHVDADTLTADQVRERADIDGGPTLAPETVRRLGCDAALVGILERDGEPIAAGRGTRTIPPALRRALRSRDHGCRFPGCDHHRFLHAHHIRHWARGGPTTLANLIQLCSFHHRLVHEGGFQIERTGRRAPRFRRPDGTTIPDTPHSTRPAGPPLSTQNHAHGIRPDPYTIRPRSEGDRLDYDIATEGLIARALAGT